MNCAWDVFPGSNYHLLYNSYIPIHRVIASLALNAVSMDAVAVAMPPFTKGLDAWLST